MTRVVHRTAAGEKITRKLVMDDVDDKYHYVVLKEGTK